MAQAKQEKMTRISATIPEPVVERFKEFCKKQRRSVSAQITLLMEQAMQEENSERKSPIERITGAIENGQRVLVERSHLPGNYRSVVSLSGVAPEQIRALTVETDLEDDGQVIAEVLELPGVLAYGKTEHEAIEKIQTLALRVLVDRVEHGEIEDKPVTLFRLPVKGSSVESQRAST
jgi:predicted RNase H-like HicB family nuclease